MYEKILLILSLLGGRHLLESAVVPSDHLLSDMTFYSAAPGLQMDAQHYVHLHKDSRVLLVLSLFGGRHLLESAVEVGVLQPP